MLTSINDILEFSKAEAGRIELRIEPISLAEVTRETICMVLQFAQSRGIDLSGEWRFGEWTVDADRLRIRQILPNPIINAVKSTPRDGKVRVVLEEGPCHGVKIKICDTGVGIAAHDIAKVLAPFGQIAAAQHADCRGTGLVLPIAKALIERHGGRLKIESAPGMGMTVVVILPSRATGRFI